MPTCAKRATVFLFCTIDTVVLDFCDLSWDPCVELFALTVLWCLLPWCPLVLKFYLVIFERRLVSLRLECRVGCFVACLADFSAVLLGFTSMFVCWPFVLAEGACVSFAVDASALLGL